LKRQRGLTLLYNAGNSFKKAPKKKTAKNGRQSSWVSPAVQLSNQLKQEFKQLYELKPFLSVTLISKKSKYCLKAKPLHHE